MNDEQPHPSLRDLEPMVGRWAFRGRDRGAGSDIRGEVALRWMEGGFYLIQETDLDYGGRSVRSTEYVGWDPAHGHLRSYCFSRSGPGPFGGVALEYVWKLEGRELTIWGGFEGSPASYRGELSADGETVSGRWQWPGGGYEATITRLG